ncbi:class I SAM-dependent DNA methyltransferase [Salinadaptatus halalkaliphilus]|uniref:site-specific DNA-methyltransferase (adenine-specific) n=1 Tax=Salinadaptatus halalkaliphilus TaxID=2419781 RepID=A0A4S3TGX7_9EURY|nr:TaqI-like C-terminal specificity domain-containing protein [Salinadaptatus halalkaliphilus]THE63102.1 class I SAM-dependent DNA methyltransferase [Salinadaptatus halalkaliphilus]
MQTALSYRTNRDLFSNHYLNEHLPETEAWDELSKEELREAKDDIMELWKREKETAPKRNESQLEEKFIRPMFRKLGVPFEVEESTSRTQRRPDYGFFESDDAARGAFERREEGGDFYKDAVAVADAKRWGRPLDTRGSGEHERDFENPSYQIHVYLQETPARWAVLTDGKKWRLYYGPTSHRLDSYYEIDLPTVLEKGNLEDFKYFYLFFRHGAFLEDSSGECFLDDVYDESNVFAQELGEDLQDNIYEAIKVLSEGFMQYPDNDLSEDDLDLIHDSSLIYLYRLIFVLYAESEGRDLLDTNNEIYEESYSLNTLKQEVAEELDSPNPKYRDWQDNLWDRLDELFKLIDQGSKSRGIPEEDLYIPAYNGGLFRTDPDEDDSAEAQFIANHQVGDAYLAEVIELLTRSQNGNGEGKIFVDYSSLDVRHLGSIYEGLLEYQLDIADEPLALEDGEYVSAGEGDEVIVEEGEVHLSTGSGERKATGSYYTPEYVVEYIVEETLGPLVDDIRSSLVGQSAFDEGGFAEEFAEEVFDLKILDPAMGSGHFLTSAIDYLAREIIDAQERQAAQQGIETVDEDHDINWARRQVAQRCIYGVDLNPLAVELAKVSLWLRTLAAEQPLAFLDHHLKTGNSLVGSDIEEIEELESDAGGDGQNATLADFGVARKGTIEQLMRIYQDFIAIENQDLADVKEMEAKYDEFERNKLRQRLEAMTNVHTAEEFGLDNLPGDAYEQMAAALEDDDQWEQIEQMQWFADAQKWSEDNDYFHWKLEYPEVFYDEDGSGVDDPGFDAVIGNPPYVRMEQIKPLKPFLASNYDVHDTRVDLYGYFVERSLELTSQRYGVVVSNKWIKSKYGQKIRGVLDDHQIEQIVDFGDLEVFEGATAYPCILTVDVNQSLENSVSVTRINNLEFESLPVEITENKAEIPAELFKGDDWTVTNPGVANISQELKEKFSSLSEYIQGTCDTSITDGMGRGVVTGLNEAFLISEEQKNELVGSDERSSQLIKPYIKGTDISRHHVDHNQQYIIYCHSGVDIDEYPAIKSYLSQYKEKLEGTATNEEWYELQQPQQEYTGIFSERKIIYPDIAKHSRFAIDTRGDYIDCTVFMIPSEDFYLLSLLNSTLIEVLFKMNSPSVRGGYHRYKNEYVKSLPIPLVTPDEASSSSNDSVESLLNEYEEYLAGGAKPETGDSNGVIREFLSELSNRMLEYNQKCQDYNTNLLDYIGNYQEGENIPDIGLFQPNNPEILNATTEQYEKLRVGNVRTERKGHRVTIYASARYKPENEEGHETDQWGYTETGYFEAFSLTDLSENQAALIEAFVPVAVEEADGFGGFRENATKTNSPIDRLKAIVLPDPESIKDDLRRYTKTKERADEIDNKIAMTEHLIDEIVYELYGLTEDEIEIVESTAQND